MVLSYKVCCLSFISYYSTVISLGLRKLSVIFRQVCPPCMSTFFLWFSAFTGWFIHWFLSFNLTRVKIQNCQNNRLGSNFTIELCFGKRTSLDSCFSLCTLTKFFDCSFIFKWCISSFFPDDYRHYLPWPSCDSATPLL